MNIKLLLREWGAASFVGTVVIGGVIVLVLLILTGTSKSATLKPPACPSYTPWVTPTGALPTPTPFNVVFASCPTPPLPKGNFTALPSTSSVPLPTQLPTAVAT
jgi:hypothetical protein